MNREYASKTLAHYFRIIAEAAGITLTSDSLAEIESIVEVIYEDAVATARREIDARFSKIEEGGS